MSGLGEPMAVLEQSEVILQLQQRFLCLKTESATTKRLCAPQQHFPTWMKSLEVVVNCHHDA